MPSHWLIQDKRFLLFPVAGAIALCLAVAGYSVASARTEGWPDDEKRSAVNSMYAEYAALFPDVPDCTVADLDGWREERRPLFVDVRPEEERAISAIPGAITPQILEKDQERYRNRPVVVYCTVGYRSAKFTQQLKQVGWDAYNLAGGILAWTHAGQPLLDGSGLPTRRVHVYGRRWALAPNGYENIW